MSAQGKSGKPPIRQRLIMTQPHLSGLLPLLNEERASPKKRKETKNNQMPRT